jgi:DNA-binding MarR family transcriptional regulator
MERNGSEPEPVTDQDFADLLAWRSSLRRFLKWSEAQCAEVGVTNGQYQLMLAVKGSLHASPTVGEIADLLSLEHHSAVGLVDRAEAASLVQRVRDGSDARVVRIVLTPLGERLIGDLASRHLTELVEISGKLGPIFASWLGSVEGI